jgi:DNA polymerase (family 10)
MDLSPDVQTMARRVLRNALNDPSRCGESGLAFGWWVEAHTIGCAEDDPDRFFGLYDAFSNDGASVVIGDPGEGVFVSVTPAGGIKYELGAEELVELGAKARRRTPLARAEEVADGIVEELRPLSDVILVAGSIRRRRPEIGDIDIVVLPKDVPSFVEALEEQGFSGGMRRKSMVIEGLNTEIYIAHDPKELGAMLFYATGDQVWNFAMRRKAQREGWKLNQYGLFDAKTGAVITQTPDERDFFDSLGVEYHIPEDRSLKDRPKGGKKKKAAAMDGEIPWA